jgi:hypothetical protein
VSESGLRTPLRIGALLGQGMDRLGKGAIEIGDDGLRSLEVFKQLADRVLVRRCGESYRFVRLVRSSRGGMRSGLCVAPVVCAG